MHMLFYWIISFLIALLITWGVLSIIIQWMNPQFRNDDGSVNLATTAWVAALIIVFTWILLWIIYWIADFWLTPCDAACAPVEFKPACDVGCPADSFPMAPLGRGRM